jgi:very-short-patch-repair endonuclease
VTGRSQRPLSPLGEGQSSDARAAGGEVSRIVHGARHVSPEALEAARRSRRSPTEAEALAWEILRARRCLGLKFRRQQVIGAFRVDFYCPALALVIEIDGGVHDDPAEAQRDEMRAQALAAEGLRVVRVRNEEVSRETFERVLGGLCRGGDDGSGAGNGGDPGGDWERRSVARARVAWRIG